MTDVCTIGHSSHPFEKFLELLRAHGVTEIADVRSHPVSRFAPQFGAKRLRAALEAAGIAYSFVGQELGARSNDPACIVDGRVDYERLARTPRFAQGLERVVASAERGRVALLCAERDPFDCHRAILVCRALLERGVDAMHIREDGAIESRATLDARVLAELDARERDLFAGDSELLAAAYRQRGRQIAYRPR
ncbi:MAG TPA: DUF488 domain-containing protein [Gammaproteobacteria bacterium]|nr:DUF488 domain-containing protein [Gammaproteobacteria bacterium]